MPRIFKILATGFIGGGLLLHSNPSSGDRVGIWVEMIRARAWVTAFADTSNPAAIPAPVDRIVIVVGGHERVLYRAGVMDRELGWPVVSPDGSRVAFVKSDSLRRQVFITTIDGVEPRPLVAMPTSALNIKGSLTSSPVAWTHDNRWLALVARIDGDPPPAERGVGGPPMSLWRVNSTTGEATRLRELQFKQTETVVAGNAITAQAWAPDGRRLVYSNSDFRAIIHDTATGVEIDIGPGLDPTWSPDGRFIAVQVPNLGEGRPGDYVVIDPNPPHRRTLLVSNAPSLFSWGGPRYLGDPVWLPDSDGVYLHRFRGLIGTPYIVRRTTGEATKMPFTFTSHSWGGRP